MVSHRLSPEEKAQRLAEKRLAERWTLEEAVSFIHDLQAFLLAENVPYYLGLTGSVLYGEMRSSAKDVDIIAYPTTASEPDEDKFKNALCRFGLKMTYSREFIARMWRTSGSRDTKHVEGWHFGRKRVDIFFLK